MFKKKKWTTGMVATAVGATFLALFTIANVTALILNRIAANYITKSDAMFWHYENWSDIAQVTALIILMVGVTSAIIIGAVAMIKEMKEEA